MRLPNDPGELYEAVQTGIYPSDLDQADWAKWRLLAGNKIVKPTSFPNLYIAHAKWRMELPITVWASRYLNYLLGRVNQVGHPGALIDIVREVPAGIELWFDGERVPLGFI